MRALIVTTAIALVMSVQIAATARAEDTTIIKKDNDAGVSTTVIKKQDDDNAVIRAPTAEDKKVIIHKDRDED